MLFNVTIEGRLTSSPETGTTRSGREYTQFEIVHRDTRKNGNGPQPDAQHFEVLTWGDIGTRAQNLRRGDLITVEAGKLLAYVDHDRRPGESGQAHERCGQPVLKIWARNISVSMRFDDAYAGARPVRQRRGDVITTPDGEQYAAEVYPEIVADLQLVHHTR